LPLLTFARGRSRHLYAALLALAAVAITSIRGRAECLPEFARELEPFPVYDAMGPVPNAWYGGWHKPRPQLLDIDGDLDLDLFVAEEDGQLRYYRNDGSVSSANFVLVTDDFAGVHELYFVRFSDVDTDGDWDLLVEAPPFELSDSTSTVERTGGYLYTNVGGPMSPVFMNLSTHPDGWFADAVGDPIPFQFTTPDFVDLDGDGDQDLLMGDVSGSVILYRNHQFRGEANFRLETTAYGGLDIRPDSCNPERPQSGASFLRDVDPRHGFMLFSFFDIDDDQLPDLFVGDEFNSNIYHWRNVGAPPSPDFVCQTQTFFPDSTGFPGEFPHYLLVTYGDLDNDGDADAILGPGTLTNDDRLYSFQNEGSASSPSFVMETGGFLPEFDRGRWSAMAFANLDGDGDQDMFFATGTSWELSYFENIGTESAAEFALVAPAWIPLPGAAWAAPEFADLDDDGDPDLIVGMTSGALRLWRNDAVGADAAGFVEIQDEDFGDSFGRTFRTHVLSQATPAFFDEDGDGDLDCLVGQWDFTGNAHLLHFRNDGTPESHDFVLASGDYQGLGVLGQNLAPELVDVDDDGDEDLLLGKFDGTIEFFQNTGAAGAPIFESTALRLGGIDVGASSVPSLVDLDADGDLDLVVGESGGGLNFFRNLADLAPSAFALLEPAEDEAVPGGDPYRFTWEAAVQPEGVPTITYDFRLADSPVAPPEEWFVRTGLTENQTTVRLFSVGFPFEPDFWWTVVARNGCRAGPVPDWRHGANDGFVDHRVELDPSSSSASEQSLPRDLPAATAITNVFPSPTRGTTSIAYVVSRPGAVRLEVFDLTGRRVAVLQHGQQGAGPHRVLWNGITVDGSLASPGIYLVRLQTEEETESRRIVRLR
jgi:hypothetical protein